MSAVVLSVSTTVYGCLSDGDGGAWISPTPFMCLSPRFLFTPPERIVLVLRLLSAAGRLPKGPTRDSRNFGKESSDCSKFKSLLPSKYSLDFLCCKFRVQYLTK